MNTHPTQMQVGGWGLQPMLVHIGVVKVFCVIVACIVVVLVVALLLLCFGNFWVFVGVRCVFTLPK